MSALALLPRLLLPQPRALAARLIIGIVLPAVVLTVALQKDAPPFLVLFTLLFMVAQAASALALAHKSVLACGCAFVQPGLRGGTALAQALWALVLGAAAVLAAGLLTPQAAAPTMVLGAAVAVYALMALVSFQTAWAFQFPLWLFYLFFFVRFLTRAAQRGDLAPWLSTGWPWLLAGGALLALLALRVRSRALHRRLSGSLVLGPEDLFRPSRVQDFKAHRARHHGPRKSMRWRARMLGAVLARAEAAAGAGRTDRVRAWLLLHAGLANGISQRPRVVALTTLAAVGLILSGGYYDSRLTGNDMQGWFGGLPFSFAALPLVGACQAMNSTATRLTSRRDGLRSELLALAWAMAATALSAMVLLGAVHILGAVLPDVPFRGHMLTFLPARPHVLLLAPLLGPFMWLAVAVRPRPDSQVVAALMAQSWLAGHALMTFLPYGLSVPLWLAVVAVVGVAAFALRRRWWRGRDQVI
jgi:hypothetical protein